ncbi:MULTISPECIES: S8 family serine peptidase [Glaesserella]|uniref:Ribosome-binding factor A n=1 Tax=Glaesserella australis TaxID=2094024 RepID=A0A328BZN0_9PAST|nr:MULTISPECIES: autotransporter serine protease [Glaesserella]AUI65559.1 ribosome-binding factor A [Glaesserella sp. 15-184]RAL19756.1 ribosome-binding factor A [Glaesserella australis]
MQKLKKYSEVALASVLVVACGGGDNSSSPTPINNGVARNTELESAPVQVETLTPSSEDNTSTTPTSPVIETVDNSNPEIVTPPTEENNVSTSEKPIVEETTDNSLSETVTPPAEENNVVPPEKPVVEETVDNSSSETVTPPVEENNVVPSEKPVVEETVDNSSSEIVTPPVEENNVVTPVEESNVPKAEIELLYPQNSMGIDDSHDFPDVAVIDVDFSVNNDTGNAFLFENGQNRLLLNYGSPRQAEGNKYSHGSMAAGVFAAKNKTAYIYGYTANSHNIVSASNQYYEAAYERGVRIFNNSYGNTPFKDYLNEKGWKYFADRGFYPMLAKWAAKDSIFVWAAGNDGDKHRTGQNLHATTESHIPVINDDARRGWITVAAVDWQGRHLMPYSSQIGETAKNWGIAARGDWRLFDDTVPAQGTSFAAPEVTAAVANVWEKFPWMSNHLVTQTILSTANKLGSDAVTDGPNAQVGWGVLNESRALKGPARFDTRLLVNSDNGFVTANFAHRNYTNNDRLTWSNDIAGDAGFKKQGTGTLYFSGNNSYAGQTIIEEGRLAISNALTQSEVIVEKNGTLQAKNDQKLVQINKSVNNKGSLEVYGKGLTIHENYTADRDARTVIDIHTATLDVKGTADMQNSRILAHVENIDGVPTQAEQARTILKAGRLENYQGFYTISDKIAPYIEVKSVTKKDNQVDVTYKRNQTEYVLRSVGNVSRSASNTGKNLDKVLDEVAVNKNSPIKSDSISIITATPLAVAQTVDSLSAEIYASSQNLVLNESRAFNEQIANQAVNTEKSEVYASTHHRAYSLSQKGYANAETKGHQSHVGATYKTENGLLGLAVYQSRQKSEFDDSVGNTKLKQQGVSIYTGYDWENSYLLAQFGMANAKQQVKRQILIPNSPRNINTDFNARLYGFYGEVGHRFKLNSTEISPFIGYQFDSIYQKAFNEGKNFGIQANRSRYHLHSYLAGVRATVELGNLSINGSLTHRFTPDVSNTFGFKARYIGAESVADIQGISPAKHITTAKLGLNYQFTPMFALYSSYGISRQADETHHDLSIGLKYRF